MIQVLVTLCFVPAVIFPFYYATYRWWSTVPGFAVMVMAIALASTMSLIFVAVVLDVRLPSWARGVIYALMGVALWTKLGALVYMNRRGRRPTPPATD